MVLEGRGARLAATKRSSAQLAEMEKQSRFLTEAEDAGQGQKYVNAIRAFKFAILEAAAAPVLLDLAESLWMRIGPFMSQYSSDIASQRLSDRHEQVAEAIRNGDSKRAEKEMQVDIQFGSEFLLTRLGMLAKPLDCGTRACRRCFPCGWKKPVASMGTIWTIPTRLIRRE